MFPHSSSPSQALSPFASPFSLEPGRDDTALFKDARIGFSHLLPGRPVLLGPAATPGDVPADAEIQLADAPITIRYHVESPSFAAASAAHLAQATATRFASWRAQADVPAEFANDSWFAAWGTEAAAVASYDVPESATSAAGQAREDLFVLVRGGLVLLVTWTYPRAFVSDPAYATFASVAEATMTWDPQRWESRGRVWPQSEFMGPGIAGAPRPKYAEAARALAGAPLLPEERSLALRILAGVVSGAGAPWVPLGSDMLESKKRAILSPLKNARVRSFVEEAFGEVRTAHDLRGLAILVGRALVEPRAASTARPSMAPPLPARANTTLPSMAPLSLPRPSKGFQLTGVAAGR